MTIGDLKLKDGVAKVVKFFLSVLLVWCGLVSVCHAASFTGPEKITIGSLGFASSVDTFSANAPTQAVLRLQKIDPARKIRWSLCTLNSRFISLDGFLQGAEPVLEYPVNLSGHNMLSILLTGERGAGLIVEVVDINRPLIKEFSASPVEIEEGAPATLRWQTENATGVTIAPASGNTIDVNGSLTATPAVTTSYTLTATNGHSIATATTVVTVRPKPPTARLTITPDTINTGESATLSWQVTGADKAVIDQGIGQVAADGIMQITPANSTTYTLTASNSGGSVTAEAAITVAPIAIDIEWPHEGDHFCDSKIVVYGRVKSAALYKYADVNGSFASVDNGLFMEDRIELKPGANIIKVEAGNYDNVGLSTEKEMTVFRDECEEWVEFALPTPEDYYDNIAPFDSTVRIIPHTTAPVNWESAAFQYNGSEAVTITRIKDDEFRFHIPVFGLYTLDFQISDENGSVYRKQLFFKGGLDLDTDGLDESEQYLEDSYIEFLKTMDADTARQKVLELADQNPDISAGLCDKALCFVYKGGMSCILDLPDP